MQILKHGIAFADLAFTYHPQFDRPEFNSLMSSRPDLSLQCQAVEFLDVLPLVKLLIELHVTG